MSQPDRKSPPCPTALRIEIEALRSRLARFDQLVAGPHAGADLPHAEVANKIRMLTRHDLDHEAVCVIARDRIILLSHLLGEQEKRHSARVTELLEANNREVERRRSAEARVRDLEASQERWVCKAVNLLAELQESLSFAGILTNAIREWVVEVFGPAFLHSKTERALRVLEEATELAQAEGVSAPQARRLLDRVYSRPAGTPMAEGAAVGVTILAWAASRDTAFLPLVAEEVTRIQAMPPEKLRHKAAEKIAAGVCAKGLSLDRG